jgi:asparagine synthase (glutamine-hydrolysing)
MVSVRGRAPGVPALSLERMRDAMTSRGPDSAGLWVQGDLALAHRRLAVIDRTEAGAQPMVSCDGRYALVYNGELYNEPELRAELVAEGAIFRTVSDTETVLRALSRWGCGALGRFRGMFALAFADVTEGRVLLARDPLGIKPLYWARVDGGKEIAFASDLGALLLHPGLVRRPDMVAASAYLTTVRTVLGERTLFEGVNTMRPGQVLELDQNGEEVRVRRLAPPVRERGRQGQEVAAEVLVERTRRAVEDSVRRHLRSDVPVCALLSGGLDSSIIATVAARELGTIRTFCSGAEGGEDFAFARLMAERLGTDHTEAPVSRRLFAERWGEMIWTLGVPLSTPNEVAISEVSRVLRSRDMVVALSGEGADELFGGYEMPMAQAAAYEGLAPSERQHPGDFQLNSAAWVGTEAKAGLLSPAVWRRVEADDALVVAYREEFEAILASGATGLDAHLLFQRRINLAGLLQRLDTATMLHSVEGRTPMADVAVCDAADALPSGLKFNPIGGAGPGRTKITLRRAFADLLPAAVLERPKASFPLPFQEWVADSVGVLRTSALAREVFTEAAIATVTAEPQRLWNLAWPMVNLALWGRRWWG